MANLPKRVWRIPSGPGLTSAISKTRKRKSMSGSQEKSAPEEIVRQLGCPRCKSSAVSVGLASWGGGLGINHIEVYCKVCDGFITHFDVKPSTPRKQPA